MQMLSNFSKNKKTIRIIQIKLKSVRYKSIKIFYLITIKKCKLVIQLKFRVTVMIISILWRLQQNLENKRAVIKRVNKDIDRSIRKNSLNLTTPNKSNVQSRVIKDGTSKTNSSDQDLEANGRTSADPNNATRTIIADDSMIKNLNEFKMSTRTARVQVSTFPGCSTLDMEDHIKLIFRKKPDKLVIHVSTNSLRE